MMNSYSNTSRPLFCFGLVLVNTGASQQIWAVRPDGHGNVTDSHVAWKLDKNVPFMPSPTIVGDLIYMVNDDGIISCVEAKTGKSVWRHRLGGQLRGLADRRRRPRLFLQRRRPRHRDRRRTQVQGIGRQQARPGLPRLARRLRQGHLPADENAPVPHRAAAASEGPVPPCFHASRLSLPSIFSITVRETAQDSTRRVARQ